MEGIDILGSPGLHEELCLSSCILAELLRQAPAPVAIEQLVREVGHPLDEVEHMCARLHGNGLLQTDPGAEGMWRLAGDPASITLADLFSALLSSSKARVN